MTANVSAYTTMAGVCPCELSVWVRNQDTDEESAGSFQIIANVPAPGDTTWYAGTASVTYLFTVASGVTNTYELEAKIIPTTAPTGGVAGSEGNVTAVYLPFGATGRNILTTTTTQGVDGRRGH